MVCDDDVIFVKGLPLFKKINDEEQIRENFSEGSIWNNEPAKD